MVVPMVHGPCGQWHAGCAPEQIPHWSLCCPGRLAKLVVVVGVVVEGVVVVVKVVGVVMVVVVMVVGVVLMVVGGVACCWG